MERNARNAVILLVITGIVDLISVPIALADDDLGAPVAVVGFVLGALTLAAAYGVTKQVPWGRTLGIVVRAIDGLLALPGIFAGGLLTVVTLLVVAMSAAAIVLLVRMGRPPRTA
jgi:hypothetical protein